METDASIMYNQLFLEHLAYFPEDVRSLLSARLREDTINFTEDISITFDAVSYPNETCIIAEDEFYQTSEPLHQVLARSEFFGPILTGLGISASCGMCEELNVFSFHLTFPLSCCSRLVRYCWGKLLSDDQLHVIVRGDEIDLGTKVCRITRLDCFAQQADSGERKTSLLTERICRLVRAANFEQPALMAAFEVRNLLETWLCKINEMCAQCGEELSTYTCFPMVCSKDICAFQQTMTMHGHAEGDDMSKLIYRISVAALSTEIPLDPAPVLLSDSGNRIELDRKSLFNYMKTKSLAASLNDARADCRSFSRWSVTSVGTLLLPVEKIFDSEKTYYLISHSPEYEARFQAQVHQPVKQLAHMQARMARDYVNEEADDADFGWAFHGTRVDRMFNILHSGLRAGTKENKLMANGNVYGPGAYCSPLLNVARCYARYDGAVQIILVCSVVNKHRRAYRGDIWVLPEEAIIPRFVLVNSTPSETVDTRHLSGLLESMMALEDVKVS